jgi:hypothetical protein
MEVNIKVLFPDFFKILKSKYYDTQFKKNAFYGVLIFSLQYNNDDERPAELNQMWEQIHKTSDSQPFL